MKLLGEKVRLEKIEQKDTPLIIKWRNTGSVRENFIFQETFTEEVHENWMKTKGVLI